MPIYLLTIAAEPGAGVAIPYCVEAETAAAARAALTAARGPGWQEPEVRHELPPGDAAAARHAVAWEGSIARV